MSYEFPYDGVGKKSCRVPSIFLSRGIDSFLKKKIITFVP